MPLPHHYNRTPIPLARLWRWATNIPNRARCWISGHWWMRYDMLTDECKCCGAKRRSPR